MGMDITNSLFQSIDTIVSARIANLPYDQTIECDVIDNSESSEGKYTVQYQAAKFIAYSYNTEFEIGDRVYVQIPKGDFNQDKTIISKKKGTNEFTVSKLAFNSFARQKFYESNDEYSLFTTKEDQKILLYDQRWTVSELQAGYTYLGIKFALSCEIADTILSNSGYYGIDIEVYGFDQSDTAVVGQMSSTSLITTFHFTPDDMISANPYFTAGYVNQQKIYNIKNYVINDIKVYLIQKGTILGENKGQIINSRIRVSNISLYFGYHINEFKTSPQLFLYTEDGLNYTMDSHEKVLKTRFLQLNEDNTISAPSTVFNSTIHWGHYNFNSSVKNTDYNWPVGFEEDTEHMMLTTVSVTLSDSQSLMSESYIVSIQNGYDNTIYTSSVLKFTNISYFEGSELLDVIKGFQVTVTNEEYNGIYNIYGQDYVAIDLTAVSTPHHFNLSYYASSASGSGLQIGDKITWKIPTENTMLRLVQYQDNTINMNTSPGAGEAIFTKTITSRSDLTESNDYQIAYYIEKYYSSNKTNNTVKFTLERDNNKYETSKELLFGPAGSQGNEYNIIMKLMKVGDQANSTPAEVEAISVEQNAEYYIAIDIYDYNNKLYQNFNSTFNIGTLENSSIQCTYQLIYNGPNGLLNFNLEDSNAILKISSFEASTRFDNSYFCIIQANIKINGRDFTAYKSIALRKNDDYTAINGTTIITYDITGKKPLYNKLKFKISRLTQQVTDSLIWSVKDINGSLSKENIDPIINNQNELIPPSIYPNNINQLNLICENGEGILWQQPIYMILNKYPGAMENSEGNPIKVSTNDTVVSPMFGLSNNDTTNQKKTNSIIMGTILENETKKYIKGLFAYYNNKKNFLISEEGNIYLNGTYNPTQYQPSNEDDSNNYYKPNDDKCLDSLSLIKNTKLEYVTIKNAELENIKINGNVVDFDNLTAKDYDTSTGNIKTKIDSIEQRLNSIEQKLTKIETALRDAGITIPDS